MNKLKTNINGGFPLKLNDLRWVESGLLDALKGLGSMCGGTSANVIILSGCVRTVVATTVSITEGYVFAYGEVCFVPAHSFTANSFEQWTVVESFDATGNKQFQNGSSQQTYLVRIGRVVPSATATAGLVVYNPLMRPMNIIRDGIDLFSWQNITTQVIAPGGSIPAGTYQWDYKIDSSGFVHFRGNYVYEDAGTGAINILIDTLPVGSRPAMKKNFYVQSGVDSGGVVHFVTIEVNTNGEVRMRSSDGLFVVNLQMAQIAPFEAV